VSAPAGFAAFPPAAGGQGPREAWLARPYPQLLRGPTLRWWRGPLSLLVVAGVTGLAFLAIGVVAVVAPGGQIDLTGTKELTPAALLLTNLTLAAFVPAAQIGVWGGYGWRPRWVASVVSGVRWSWLAGCAGVSALVVAVGLAVSIVLAGGIEISPEQSWAWYLLVVLVSTPLQAAGEEYLFRGWLTQTIGSYLAKPVVGALVAGGVSSVLFALAHGVDQGPWLFVDRLAFGIAASWLVWRTGGLEASIALHVLNNLGAFLVAILTGSMKDALTVTTASAGEVLVDVVLIAAGVAAIDWLARRSAVRRMFAPPIR
jgi:uncharacterized protein